ncbi:potassium channel subfamily K member 6 [Esox lucius]|uniref:Potassium channel subfamily K member n=1 Tax=Esox lucius TaxID=8010 RepID=A0A3P8Y811_ESOLU|nr:potassium channel subfamily K member 6 [Esox lucius]
MTINTLKREMSSGYKSWILLTGFILFYITYLMLGALVFSTIERPVEDTLKTDIKALKEEFLNQSCVNATSLDNFLERVLQANKYGISVLPNSSASSNWDLASSLFFANTLVTTVGYGHTTPLSDTGKAFSIFYALVGVPFTMLVLTACVQRLMHLVTYGPIGVCRRRMGLDPRTATAVHFAVLLLLVVLGFFVVPAVVFSQIEDTWSFLDAVYFCFISLCTIGLGDYVPGEQPSQRFRALYKISVMVYLFLGLMMMYLVLRSFHRMADLHGLTAFFQLPHCDEDAEDREPIVKAGSEDQNENDLNASAKPLDPTSKSSYNAIQR